MSKRFKMQSMSFPPVPPTPRELELSKLLFTQPIVSIFNTIQSYHEIMELLETFGVVIQMDWTNTNTHKAEFLRPKENHYTHWELTAALILLNNSDVINNIKIEGKNFYILK